MKAMTRCIDVDDVFCVYPMTNALNKPLSIIILVSRMKIKVKGRFLFLAPKTK